MAEERFNHTLILVINLEITSALDYNTEFLVDKSWKQEFFFGLSCIFK